MNNEEYFVKAFIPEEKQERYLLMLSEKKKRSKLLDGLNHNLAFDRKFAALIPSGR
jgi:hypothetical protein